MFKPNNGKPNLPNSSEPSAPPSHFGMYNAAATGDQYAQRAPPPTYEESQQLSNGAMGMQQQQWLPPYGMQAQHQMAMPPQYQYQQQHISSGYANSYQYAQCQTTMPHQYQQNFVAPMAGAQIFQTPGTVPVLELHKGAEVRTSVTGAVHIPPPPPGCAATPAQLAAMQGQTVLVKPKKNSFF